MFKLYALGIVEKIVNALGRSFYKPYHPSVHFVIWYNVSMVYKLATTAFSALGKINKHHFLNISWSVPHVKWHLKFLAIKYCKKDLIIFKSMTLHVLYKKNM